MTVRRFIKKYGRRKKRRVGNLLSIGTICIVLIAAFALGQAMHHGPHLLFGQSIPEASV